MLVGSDESNYKTVEAAIGRKVDVIRAYRYKGQNHSSLLALASAGYGVWASYKFRDANGTVAATAVTGHQLDGDLDVFDQVMEQLAKANAPHRKGYEHEEDAKAAAGSGTPAALNAAVTYCIDRRKAQAKAAGLQTFQCWTGFDLLNREPLYRVSGEDVDVLMLDPYAFAVPGPSLVASYGQDFNWLAKIYPGKPICLGEVNAPNTGPAGAQAAWLNQGRHDLESQFPMVDGACLWQGGNLSETAAELALMKTGFFASAAPTPTPPPPPPPSPSPSPSPTPPPDIAAELAAALAQIVTLQGQIGSAAQTHASDLSQITAARTQLAAVQTQANQMTGQITAARTAAAVLTSALGGSQPAYPGGDLYPN